MPFELFHSRFPELAKRETRTVTVLVDSTKETMGLHDVAK